MGNTVKNGLLALFLYCSWMVTAQESYILSAESVLNITGTSTVHDWEVVANSILGSLKEDDKGIHDLIMEIPVSEIRSERGPTMDNKMHAALKGEEHPKVIFALKSVKEQGIFKGMLTIAGVEKEINAKVELVRHKDKLNISGSQEILLKDYGMQPPTAMFGQIVVGESVTVVFDLVFLRE